MSAIRQPSRAGKQRCEGNENGCNGIGQGDHGCWAFPSKVGSGQLALPLYFFYILREA